MRRAAALAVALALAPAAAQVPDSLAARARAAGAQGAPRPPADVVTFGPAPGSPISPVPAVTAALAVDALLNEAASGRAPAAWTYGLGAPGRSGGAAFDALDPATPSLTLDGRPFQDPVTDAPRLDLLPLALVGPLRWSPALGRTQGLAVATRGFRLAVPVTELRYLGGQNGLRHVSGVHAQTRRPPALLRGSDDDRLTATFYAANRAADSPLTGGNLRHTEALGRLLLTRPDAALEAGVLYTDRTEGARRGLVAKDGFPATALASLGTADVLDPSATRRTLRTEGWVRARAALFGAPGEIGASLAGQRLVYRLPPDTLRVHSPRLAAFAEQTLPAGLSLRLDATYDPAPDPGQALLPVGSRLGLHGVLTDSLRLGGALATVSAGVHSVGGATWPSAEARAQLGAASLGLRLGGRAPSRFERAVGGASAPERTLAGDVSAEGTAGDWRLGGRAFGSVTWNGLFTLARSADSLDVAVVVADAPIQRAGAALGLGWRERTRRGIYLSLDGAAQAVLAPAGDLESRLDASLPRLWVSGRLGLRAEGVGDGVLDLDLAAVGQGWTAHRGRRVEPVTGALVLPQPGGPLGAELPPRATLGLAATATFSERASLFLRYDHALGGRLYATALVTQGEPLAPHVLRFGVFWALLN